jgi:hypothetical protein
MVLPYRDVVRARTILMLADGVAPARLDPVAIPKGTLEKLLHHAAFAAHLVGHLDDNARADLIGQLGDHVDAIVHGLTELLGDPRTLAAPDSVAPDDRVAYDDPPMLASSAGGAP